MKCENLWSVTSYGYSATRWFSFVLASHPEVFVAHGTYDFDSIIRGDFFYEKNRANNEIENLDALISGRSQVDLIKPMLLNDLYTKYVDLFPDYSSYGNVHSYVCREVFYKDDFDIISPRVYHLIREPFSFIDSHAAGVKSAENVEELRLFYCGFFDLFIERFPEVSNLNWFDKNSLEQKSFLLSLYTLHNIAQDEIRYGKKMITFRMEDLTSDLSILCDACELITHKEYDKTVLREYLDSGAVNRHRRGGYNKENVSYLNWPSWKRESFEIVIENKGYLSVFKDLGYL